MTREKIPKMQTVLKYIWYLTFLVAIVYFFTEEIFLLYIAIGIQLLLIMLEGYLKNLSNVKRSVILACVLFLIFIWKSYVS